MPKAEDHTETSDKARSRGRSETDRDDKTMFATVRENSDTGAEEAYSAGMRLDAAAWSANMKRTYDEFLARSLENSQKGRTHFDTLISNAQNYSNLALQSAVTTVDMLAKQAVRHNDVAIDRQWNVDEVAQLVAKTGVQSDAFVAILAKAVAGELSKK